MRPALPWLPARWSAARWSAAPRNGSPRAAVALPLLLLPLLLLVGATACVDTGGQPDENPVMRNPEPPFRYPAALYALKVQGNVTLRLYVDETGAVLPESTKVHESSSYPAFDSAAVAGSESLRFVPAKRAGEPMAVSILFPVFFRHPAGKPLSGDTVLQRQGADSQP